MMTQFSLKLTTLEDTHKLANFVASIIVPNFVISLNGNLGAGKTTFVREVIRAFGVQGNIKSPTFTLVEPYELPGRNIFHFDLYRFSDPEEWFDAGFDEYFTNDFIAFIEWAEKAEGLIPQLDWQINIKLDEKNERIFIIDALTKIGEECLTTLTKAVAI